MVASAFMVRLVLTGGQVLEGGVDTVIVWAESATAAKALAAGAMGKDGSAAMWAGAVATALVVGTELEGWKFKAILTDNLTPFTLITAEFTGLNAATVDDMGTGLAAALVAAGVAGAAYNTGTNVLTIVETTDAKGDWGIILEAYPPAAVTSTSLLGFGETAKPIDGGFFGAITAAGASGIARLCTLVASLPALYGVARSPM